MSVLVLKSDEARQQWRNLLDKAMMGDQVVVERYTRPEAVIVGYSQFSAMTERLETLEAWAEAQSIDHPIESGEAQVVTFEQHKTRMQAKGARYDLGNRVQPGS